MLTTLALAALLAQTSAAAPQPTPSAPKQAAKSDEGARKEEKEEKEEPPVVTKHVLTAAGKTLSYTATTGFLPLKNDAGETEAKIFFMAYTLDRGAGPASKRPLTFSFNGGPGAASVWLHMGALGPKRVKMKDADGMMPAPPYTVVDNEDTWLPDTDLVFIDPVGTGYSRASKPELGKKFWGLDGDIASVGEFIRLYLTRYERWGSPLFLVGESYGTTRAAGLSGYLVDRGIAFNGILLVSSILNFQTARFTRGNDLPYPLFLPTYTATAWYHKKLPADLQGKPLRAVLDEVEAFAGGEYPVALARGDALTPGEHKALAQKLARYTGLDAGWIERSDERIEIEHFCRELLAAERKNVGRIDSRFTGDNESGVAEQPDFDPSIAAIVPPYTAAFNQYVRADLGYKSDLTYFVLGGGISSPWEFPKNSFADTSGALRSAFAKNPSMRLFVASGHFDLATPHFATRYTLAHMGLTAEQRARITSKEYEAGHMMYLQTGELAKLRKDVAAFFASALGK
ncbi:MAG TPA: peptidase S10 [Thermoanaerobaculia bacterium]|nr:peptidase S10 [Thermoanaerobaculia bacterium]